MKFLRFVLFVAAYLLWAIAAYAISKKSRKSHISGNFFWYNQLVILLSYGGFFTFVYILSGFWNFKLVGLCFATAQLGVVTGAIFWGFLGAASDKTSAQASWAAGEFLIRHPRLSVVLQLALSLVFLAYLVGVGIGYFGRHWKADDLTVWIFRYSLVVFFFLGYLAQLPALVSVLLSSNVHQNTRQHLLVGQLCGLIPTAFLLALAFWSFGAGGTTPVAFGNVQVMISPKMIAILLLFFGVTSVIPYMIGARHARSWNAELLDRRKRAIDGLIDILDAPTHSLYSTKLTQFKTELTSSAFLQDDPIVKLAAEIEASGGRTGSDPNADFLIELYRESRDLDPRFQYLDSMHKLSGKIVEVSDDLVQKQADTAQLSASAGAWVKHFRRHKTELERQSEIASKPSYGFTAVLGLLTTVASTVLTEVGKEGWNILSDALSKR